MEFEIVEIKYSVTIKVGQMLSILNYEQGNVTSLWEKLRDIGCSEVEYDGHFGPYINFTVDKDDSDDKEFMEQIKETIEEHIKLAGEK